LLLYTHEYTVIVNVSLIGSFSFVAKFLFFFSVNTMTHETLHLACCKLHEHVPWQPLEAYGISRSKPQRSRLHGFFCLLCVWYCGYPWAVLRLEQDLTVLFCLCFFTFVDLANGRILFQKDPDNISIVTRL